MESHPLGVVLERSNRWTIGLLRDVVAKERDPAVADKAATMGRKRRLPIQLYYVIAVTCRRRVSLAVRRVFQFRVRGMETAVQRVGALGFVAISVDAPGTTAVNENRQSGAGKSTAIR